MATKDDLTPKAQDDIDDYEAGGSRLIRRNGSINPEAVKDHGNGRMSFVFKPSAKPGVDGAFIMPASAMEKLGKAQLQHEAVNDPDVMAVALDLIIDIVIRTYNNFKPQHLKRGLLPRRWRWKMYRHGMYQILKELQA